MKKYENYSLIEKTLSKANIKVKDYKNILSKMMDEKSKYMFFYRTMFDNTGNPKYALKLEKCMYEGDNFLSISDKYMYDFLDFMLRNSNYNKKIYIIGYSPEKDLIYLLSTIVMLMNVLLIPTIKQIYWLNLYLLYTLIDLVVIRYLL